MTLMWEMPKAGQVQLKIQDIQGKTVFNRKEKFAAGAQELTWNGQNTKGAKIPAGMYVVTLRGDGWEVSKKVVRE